MTSKEKFWKVLQEPFNKNCDNCKWYDGFQCVEPEFYSVYKNSKFEEVDEKIITCEGDLISPLRLAKWEWNGNYL